jgi:transposase-like protein
MSLMDSKRTSENGTATYTAMNHQICPRCYKEMRVEVIGPTMFVGVWDQITYVCKECGTEELQTVRR